ncbi:MULTISPECIES: class I SAM-dependent methyltransferase [Nocardia]|uniref:class I SAM-dependent methyltransferase n=1 Tax=Nocardia TaxID=1817 RepID=UPI0018953ECD|nr:MULTISPECIES: class I SAM-dependent methyltransferase [Nocardia]MBF6349522.1 class I SAM-dependent methyltransferase [Nocardia flavorosea]
MDQQFWDDMYGETEQRFSGLPNDALVAEVTGMTPGQALDLGCGEGADAYWLAEHGWQVTAVDISKVAIERASAGHPEISWQQADIAVTPMPARSFDLVSAHYFPIAHEPDHATVRGLLESVAPGGTLLFVAHDPAEFPEPGEHPHGEEAHQHEQQGHQHRFDPYAYYLPADIRGLLDDKWTVEVDERRDRNRPAAAHQIKDLVLRVRRAN